MYYFILLLTENVLKEIWQFNYDKKEDCHELDKKTGFF